MIERWSHNIPPRLQSSGQEKMLVRLPHPSPVIALIDSCALPRKLELDMRMRERVIPLRVFRVQGSFTGCWHCRQVLPLVYIFIELRLRNII